MLQDSFGSKNRKVAKNGVGVGTSSTPLSLSYAPIPGPENAGRSVRLILIGGCEPPEAICACRIDLGGAWLGTPSDDPLSFVLDFLGLLGVFILQLWIIKWIAERICGQMVSKRQRNEVTWFHTAGGADRPDQASRRVPCASAFLTSDCEIPNCLAIADGLTPALKAARTAFSLPVVNEPSPSSAPPGVAATLHQLLASLSPGWAAADRDARPRW